MTVRTQQVMYAEMVAQGVHLPGTILKASMVVSGKDCAEQAGVDEVAERTVACLRNAVPASVPGVVFLSGGQSAALATAHLNAMNALSAELPWALSFSYGRALQDPALRAWAGKAANAARAQELLAARERLNALACLGRYTEAMEEAA